MKSTKGHGGQKKSTGACSKNSEKRTKEKRENGKKAQKDVEARRKAQERAAKKKVCEMYVHVCVCKWG